MPKQLKMNETFLEAVPILRRLQENGYEAYFVGGSVRDALLGKEIEDVDIATSAFPEEVKSLFTRTIDVGIEHGTVMVLFEGESYEITTFRTESEYQDYRRPDQVTFVRSLEEDLKRRDFTINALAMDENGHIIDYFNGMRDMSHRLIKAVGEPSERFYEDALRMMRAVRFQAQLDFQLDEKTFAAIKKHHSLLGKISVERIQVEFSKMMLGQGYKKGIQSFIDSGLYQYCPELSGEKEALEKMCGLTGLLTSTIQMWTLLLYFIGLSLEEVEPFMRKWKCSKKEISTVKKALIGLLERLQVLPSNRYVFEMGLDIGLEVERMLELLHQDAQPDRIQQIYQQLPIQRRNELAVNGNELMAHLNKKAGKWLGPLLDELERAVVEMEVENEKQALLQTAEAWAANEEN